MWLSGAVMGMRMRTMTMDPHAIPRAHRSDHLRVRPLDYQTAAEPMARRTSQGVQCSSWRARAGLHLDPSCWARRCGREPKVRGDPSHCWEQYPVEMCSVSPASCVQHCLKGFGTGSADHFVRSLLEFATAPLPDPTSQTVPPSGQLGRMLLTPGADSLHHWQLRLPQPVRHLRLSFRLLVQELLTQH